MWAYSAQHRLDVVAEGILGCREADALSGSVGNRPSAKMKGCLVHNTLGRTRRSFVFLTPFLVAMVAWAQSPSFQIGREVAIPVHLQDGEEFTIPIRHLIEYGSRLFDAKFTIQEGAGRPQSKGTGAPSRIPALRWCFREISTASPHPKQTRVLVVTMRPSPVPAATA